MLFSEIVKRLSIDTKSYRFIFFNCEKCNKKNSPKNYLFQNCSVICREVLNFFCTLRCAVLFSSTLLAAKKKHTNLRLVCSFFGGEGGILPAD